MIKSRLALPELRLAELVEEVRLLLRLDTDIRRRLEMPHGWDQAQIDVHHQDLKARDECRERLHAIVARETVQTTGEPM